MSRTALIGVDWGTTSFRAYRIADDGEVLEALEAALGILRVSDRSFEKAFEVKLESWLDAEPSAPILIAGMITSRQGWIETDYLRCPAGCEELAAVLARLETKRGRRLHFVTGLTTVDAAGMPDVMRGEETQVVGAWADDRQSGLVVLPGTHSKWVLIEGGKIVRFATFMTGEVYGALKDHTILGRLMTGDVDDAAAFKRGVDDGFDNDPARGGLLRRLFGVRSHGLVGNMSGEVLSSYLSGLLIGSEIREALSGLGSRLDKGLVTVIASEALLRRYARALSYLQRSYELVDGDASARGLYRIAGVAKLFG